MEHDGEPFDIQQNASDGSIHVANVRISHATDTVECFCPLNSREDWPLLATVDDYGEDVPVFTPAGEVHPEFTRLLDTIHQ